MDSENKNNLETGDQSDSLENTSPEVATQTIVSPSTPEAENSPSEVTVHKVQSPKQLSHRLNIYMILFIGLIIAGLIMVFVAYQQNKKGSLKANLSSGNLSASSLAQLANTDSTIGSNGQVINIQSSAIFSGKVLARQDLDVAGNLVVGGTLGLNDITVNGTAQLAQAKVSKDLSVAGNSNLQGAVNIAKTLQVGGGANFGGSVSAPQLTVSSLQLNGDLTLTHHITAGGATPGRSNGNALGSGGTSSISGSDTAGSISINTGGGPSAGCFITVNFTAKFSGTPHVVVTPIGASAGGLSYYVNRSSTSFSICDTTTPPAGSSFGFDYIVFD